MPKLSVGESFTVALFSDSEKSLDRRGEIESRFSVELFMSQSARKIRRLSFTVALLLGYRKSLEKRWGGRVSRLSVEKFLTHSAETFRRESFTVALLSGTENVWRRGGGGISRFYVKKFLTHSAETFRRGIFYCCIIFR